MTKNLSKNVWLVAALGVCCAAQTKGALAADKAGVAPRDITSAGRNTQSGRDAGLEEEIAGRLEEQSRFTLSLREEPLSEVMALLETATAVRFRCGTLPDALISVNAQDAPLLATIEPLFQDMGFAMRRDGLDLFVFSNRVAGSVENNANLPVSWSLWKGKGAPPAGWMNARAVAGRGLSGRVSAESLIKGSPLALGWNAPHTDNLKNADWQNVALKLDTERHPGISVVGPQNEKESAVWMRWPLHLREVPAGAQLLLETPCNTTLFVNGAPLISNRRGSMLVDLGRVLQRGSNCLALHWASVPQSLKEAPLLRYEWFVAGKMNAPSTASLAPPLYETPSVSQPVLQRPDNGRRPGESGATIAEANRR